jgi:hypothetical protein
MPRDAAVVSADDDAPPRVVDIGSKIRPTVGL